MANYVVFYGKFTPKREIINYKKEVILEGLRRQK
jgi:hypothetical protein